MAAPAFIPLPARRININTARQAHLNGRSGPDPASAKPVKGTNTSWEPCKGRARSHALPPLTHSRLPAGVARFTDEETETRAGSGTQCKARLPLRPGWSHKGAPPGLGRGAQESREPNIPGATLAWGSGSCARAALSVCRTGRGRGDQDPCALCGPRPQGPWRRPAPPGNQGGGWRRGEMRGTCENSLLTAKVTTLFPGPKRDNGRAGKVYIKAGRAEDQPP